MIDHLTSRITNTYVVLFLTLLACLGLAVSARAHVQAGSPDWWSWADGAFQNFSTEMMGAVITFILFELAVGNRNRKKNFVIQMRSKDNITALNAVDQLRFNRYFYDGSLQGSSFYGANLKGARLHQAKLKNVNFGKANLLDADFWDANLQDADFHTANLQNVDFRNANLKGADMRNSNLQDANLEGTNLQGVNLKDANLQGASLKGAIFDVATQLPESTYWQTIFWESDTDMERFTDPEHADFWQPDWVKKQNEDKTL